MLDFEGRLSKVENELAEVRQTQRDQATETLEHREQIKKVIELAETATRASLDALANVRTVLALKETP